jgi:hypothetical protein
LPGSVARGSRAEARQINIEDSCDAKSLAGLGDDPDGAPGAKTCAMRPAAAIVLAAAFGLSACSASGEPDKQRGARSKALSAQPAAPVPAGRNPVDVAIAGDAVWVLDQAGGRLSRHDAASGRRQRSSRVGRSPFALASGEDAVWVLDAASGVQRVDPATSRPAGKPVRVADPNGIALGAGAVWVTSRTAGTVTRIDAASLRRDAPIKIGTSAADVVFADGGVWVADPDGGTVTRVDALTRKAAPPLRLTTGQVLALAAGGGAVYAAVSKTELNNDLRLLRIDPKAAEVSGVPIPITGGIPLRLAAAHGSVWATDIGSSLPGSAARAPALLRIDPATRTAKTIAAIPGRPSSVATSPGAVWVTDSTRGTLTRVALR